MTETALVHPWTQKWWQSLPAIYKSADTRQFAPASMRQVGLNQDPIFEDGAAGWAVSAPTQETGAVSARLQQTFTGVSFTKPFGVQVWWSAPVPGAQLSIQIFGQGPSPLAESLITEFTEPSGMELVSTTASPSSGSALTVRVEMMGLVAEDNSLSFLTLDAINVGYVTVPFEALPGVLEEIAYPLMRYMDGPGRVAGQMREISDQAWAGNLTNPSTTPDHAIPWLAQMLGTPTAIRNLPTPKVRTYLQDMATEGRPAAGTRQSIITSAKQFLIGEGQALIQPAGPTTPEHTIIMLVRADQVPDGDLPALTAKVRASGVIPAGHILSIRMAISEWDTWEAAAGVTWAEVESNAPTWAVADSLGIELEEPPLP